MQRKYIIRILALVCIAILLLCAGCTQKPAPTPSEEPSSEEITLPVPNNPDMEIETPYCSLTIPFAFSELVSYTRTESDGIDSYTFSAALEDQTVPVYVIHFAKGEDAAPGELFGMLQTDDGTVRVLYEAYNPEDTIQGDDLESFYTAQETINDVFASVQAASGFTAS